MPRVCQTVCYFVKNFFFEYVLQVLESQRPSVTSMPTSEAISSVIRTAAQTFEMQPLTSFEQIESDVRSNIPLQETFKEEVRKQTAERLRDDTDYVSLKYPNSEKYYRDFKY